MQRVCDGGEAVSAWKNAFWLDESKPRNPQLASSFRLNCHG
jgi:hypothetical protein